MCFFSRPGFPRTVQGRPFGGPVQFAFLRSRLDRPTKPGPKAQGGLVGRPPDLPEPIFQKITPSLGRMARPAEAHPPPNRVIFWICSYAYGSEIWTCSYAYGSEILFFSYAYGCLSRRYLAVKMHILALPVFPYRCNENCETFKFRDRDREPSPIG